MFKVVEGLINEWNQPEDSIVSATSIEALGGFPLARLNTCAPPLTLLQILLQFNVLIQIQTLIWQEM